MRSTNEDEEDKLEKKNFQKESKNKFLIGKQ